MTSITPIPLPPPQQDEIRTHLPTLHARFLSLQSSSSRRIGPAMAFFEPFLRRSPTLSFVRCTVCVPGPVPRAVAESVKMELSKAVRSDAGPAVSKGKVSRIRGFVARSSRTAAGGTSSLFNHAHRSHPALLAALREIIERDIPPGKRISSGRITKKKKRKILANITPPAGAIRIAALAATALLPPGVIHHAATLAREIPPSRNMILETVWPYLRNEIRTRLIKKLEHVPGVGITIDRWAVAGNSTPLYAVNLHFLEGWKKSFCNLGVLPAVRGAMLDPTRLLETFAVRDKVFGLVSKDVPIIIEGRISDVVGDCFRANCLFTQLADTVRKVIHGEIGDQPLVLHGESETTLDGAITMVARCVSLIKESPEGRVETTTIQPTISEPEPTSSQLIPPTTTPVASVAVPQPNTGIQDLMSDSVEVGVAAATRAAAAAAAASEAPEAASVVADVPTTLQTPKPWLRGNFISMLHEFENLTNLHISVHGLNEDHLQSLRDLADEHWVVVRTITRVLSLVREQIAVSDGWCDLPDAIMKMINLICAICDRLTEIEVLVDQSLVPNTQLPLRQYIDEFLRARQIRQEDAVGTSPFISILEGFMLYHLLDGLYPIIQPLLEYVPKQAYRIMALALDPRFCSLAVLITLNKKLLQGSRLVFEKEFHGDEGEGTDERIRKRVRNMSVRYDEEVIVPLMNSMNSRFPGGNRNEQVQQKVGQETEEGLFEETFEPTEDWKNRHQLLAELAKFRSFKKNISRTASSTEGLAWWDNNAELFPNIWTLFQKVVSVPASHAPLERVIGTADPKTNIARRRLTRSGLEDLIFIHENLSQDMSCDIQGLPRAKEDVEKEELFGDDELFELAPELFATE